MTDQLSESADNRDTIDDNELIARVHYNEQVNQYDITNEDETPRTETININKQADEPDAANSTNSSNLLQQEVAAVEELLAGRSKDEFHEELSNIDDNSDSAGIEFRHENVLLDQEALSDVKLPKIDAQRVIKRKRRVPFTRTGRYYFVRSLKRRSIKYLNKMHAMEDVREACDVQPASPGHAEQGPEETALKLSYPENSCLAAKDEVKELTNGNKAAAVPLKENALEADNTLENNAESGVTENDRSKTKSPEDKNTSLENGTNSTDDSIDSIEGKSCKRKLEDEEDKTAKKLKDRIQDCFSTRDKILTKYIELSDCSTVEQIHTFTEQIIAEIKTLNDLAKEKEREWNNIIHLKKLKEELLLRVQRKKHLLILNEDKNDPDTIESQLEILEDKMSKSYQSSMPIQRTALSKGVSDKSTSKNKSLLANTLEMNGQSQDYRQVRQRPILDVQSIIADYRQRHPEAVPRRGRRIRSVLNQRADNANNTNTLAGGILNFSSVALGSGSQVRQNSSSGLDVNQELGLLLSALNSTRDGPRSSNVESSNVSETSFKDMLMQFAKLSQSERHELIQNAIKPPPPYPEVTVHPVTNVQSTTNSLLHGILTKTTPRQSTKTSFSPTLARLLTAPERAAVNSSSAHSNTQSSPLPGANVSISDILSTNKSRNEITITPVGQYDTTSKDKQVVQTEEEEAEDGTDRLIIDEGSELADNRNRNADNSSDAGDDIPQCQGCNQRPAQFVCAGCGNQWYCSRDCQVSAWDEHSEVCSG